MNQADKAFYISSAKVKDADGVDQTVTANEQLPLYTCTDDTHVFTWQDTYRVEIVRPYLHYDRLYGQMLAYNGADVLNNVDGSLLDDGTRQRFADACNRVNGAISWLPRLLLATHTVSQELRGTTESARERWNKAIDFEEFITLNLGKRTDDMIPDLLYPGCVTFVVSPRGLGKSVVTQALAIALGTGGRFREHPLCPSRVLLCDRDNPPHVVQERLKHWRDKAFSGCKVLTRDDVPLLSDRSAWQALPVGEYEVVVLDSFGSMMEDTSEKEPKAYLNAMRTVKDLARRGPAVLALHNPVKSGANFRGRGELADMIDVLYEVRDCTNWTPPTAECWWEYLPEAGEEHWKASASRRQQQAVFRLAFTVTKFRLGLWPEAFMLEVDTRQTPWTLRDVTAEVLRQGEEEAKAQARAERDQMDAAVKALEAEITRRYYAGNAMKQTEADTFLVNQGFKRSVARNLRTSHLGTHWQVIDAQEGQSGGYRLVPLCTKNLGKASGISDDRIESSQKEGQALPWALQADGKAWPQNDPHKTSSENSLSFAVGSTGERQSLAPVSVSNDAGEKEGVKLCRAKNFIDTQDLDPRIYGTDIPPGRMKFARPARNK